jgi:nucleoside transporter
MEATTSAGPAAPADPFRLDDSHESAIKLRLSIMMFLQYAIWGAWLPLFFAFLTGHRGLTGAQAGLLFSIGATGALLAPFIAGQIADRWFNTEKFLAISHLIGAVLVWKLATVDTWPGLISYSLLYSLVYAPTLALTNSLAFHHLTDRDRDFGKVRVWGTIGWIVVGIGFAQYLLYRHTPAGASEELIKVTQLAGIADSLRLSAILGVVMAIYCLTLPKTPPQRGKQNFAAAEALKEVMAGSLKTLFLVAFFVGCIHQFYFVLTAPFLQSVVKLSTESGVGMWLNRIFGAGGGGLMTIGQISEIVVLAIIPFFATRYSRKALLTVGLLAYIVRFAVFAFLPVPVAVVPALALHGLCFGCFIFVAFMIVDEETSKDVRASAQGLFNLVIVGLGTIIGNLFAGQVAAVAALPEGGFNFRTLFAIPMAVGIVCLLLLLALYPRKLPATAKGLEQQPEVAA